MFHDSTCGLQKASVPHSTNLTPRRTTEDAPDEMASDGPLLSCPGNHVVTEDGVDTDTIDLLAVAE